MKRLALLLSLLLVACDDVATRVKRLVRPEKPLPVVVDVICDHGGGAGIAGCTEASLTLLLREVAPGLPPGSVVRLHGMTDDVALASQLASFVITAPKKRTVRAVAGHRQRQVTAMVEQFLAAAQPVFAQDERKQSPVFETIARVLMTETPPNAARRILVSSDVRHVSKASPALGKLDYECGEILPGEELAQRLRKLVAESSVKGVAIEFRHTKLEPIAKNRCAATVERYALLKDSVTRAYSELGARVTWNMN